MPKIMLDGEKIRQRRTELDMSQAELAEKCGLGGHSIISKIESQSGESGHGVMLETAGLIADVLGVPIDVIVERHYTPPPQASTTNEYEIRHSQIERIIDLAKDLPLEKLKFVLDVAETQLYMHRQEALEKEKAAQASED
jgi:transcriptional regulator with XRE-family HTH domain